MLEFKLANPGPVVVKLAGVEYHIPRLLLPGMAEWMEETTEKIREKATQHMGQDDKARFLMYHPDPMFDVTEVAMDCRTPAGVLKVLRRQLPKATPTVPNELIERLITEEDPERLALLSSVICSAVQARANVEAKTGGAGDRNDPLTGSQRESGAAPSTGSKPKPKSLARTPRSGKKRSPSTNGSSSGSDVTKPSPGNLVTNKQPT